MTATATATAAAGAVALVGSLLLGTTTPSATPTTAPAAPAMTRAVRIPFAVEAGRATTWPVVDLAGPVEDLVFGEATVDGAVSDLGGRQFRLASDVLFAFDKADLTPRARQEIARIARELATEKVSRLAVTGYTDAEGSGSYNLALSRRRAEAVRAALTQALPGVTVTAAGRGEADPIASNTTDAGRRLNRRVEIRVG